MPRALILTESSAAAFVAPEPLRLALLAAGYSVIDEITEPQRLLKRAIAIEPEVLVVATPAPSKALFEALRALHDNAPCTVAVYSSDAADAHIEAAAACGVQIWETGGFSGTGLAIQLTAARARFKLVHGLRAALADAEDKLEERKLVDRAKGILMQTKRMSEHEAYAALRKLAMEKKLKMGAIAEQIINTAQLLA